ncbi:hypothetical protein JGS22_014590 [Streptomyces sp. P38-E01]|uniref:Uncharacterized protein n=1 Tax=Streptomyces tardus TaxID=2780544 RepID=A0A949N8Q5_9ACTN|nr:hypothetical protein [Streptomyces tardus]MBU7598806.1 hypothetical protein [Streptomyces tardus]
MTATTPTTATANSLKARPYLHYAPVPDGVYFSGPGAQFVLKGPALLYQVADVCVPLLEAGTTEDALVAALRSERSRPVVRKLVSDLRRHELMLDLEALTAPEPPEDVRARFPEALTHLEAATNDPYALFERLRAAAVLLCGPAETVLPAARGLHRAGLTELTLATEDPGTVATTAERLGLRVVATTAAGLPEELPDGLDAVLYALDSTGDRTSSDPAPDTGADTGADALAGLAARLPAGVPVVPVWWHERVLLAGPAVRGAAQAAQSAALVTRAARWAADEDLGSPPAPTARALAGALAGQLLYETLAGIAEPGRAHVVYGDDLATEPIAVAPARPGDAPVRRALTATPAANAAPTASAAPVPSAAAVAENPAPDAAPTPEQALETVVALTARWTGPFTRAPGLDLPQLPLALRETADRSAGFGSLVNWAGEQRTATVAGALAALRATAPDESDKSVAAAGLTEEQWLLDGALRLLAEDARSYASHGVEDELSPEALRFARALADEGLKTHTVTLLRHPGLDWRLARVTAEAGSESYTGLSWGPDGPAAAQGALGAVLADAQTRAHGGGARVPGGVHTDALLFLDDAARAALRDQVVALADGRGLRYEGVVHAPDAVLGTAALWSGEVTAETAR